MDLYDWLLALHVTGAFLFLGGAFAAAVLNLLARRADRPSEIALFLGLTRVPVVAIGVGMAMTIVFGLWLVFHLDGYDLLDGWVIASLLLWLLSGLLGSLGGQREKATRLEAERLAADRDVVSPELRERLRDRMANSLSWGSGVAALGILALMVWKPGA